MRRFFSIILTAILLLTMSFNISVFAASNTYDLDELELQVSIPSEYSVITRDTPDSDPIFSDLGTTGSAIISQFETSNIYLNAISDTHNEEVVVTMTQSSLTNFSLLSDITLDTYFSTLESQYSKYGINVSKYEIYQHAQAKFVKFYFTNTAKTVYGLQYYTIYNGKAMNFTMRSYEGSLSARQQITINKIVDSIKYDKAPSVSDPGQDTSPFIYADTESGVAFTIPADWKQEEFTKDRQFIDVKFVSTEEDGCVIIYGSTDIWGQMPEPDKIGYIRANLNSSVFTISDIAEMYGTTEDKISTVTYNGVQYFKGEPSYSTDIYGMDISLTMTQLVYFDNGWMYMFQFGGTSTHKLYSDFESLLKSVQYPTASDVAGVGSSDKTPSETNNSTDNSGDYLGVIAAVVLLSVVAVIVVAVVVVISLRKNTETKNRTSYTSVYNTPAPQPLGNSKPTSACKNYGQALPLDSTMQKPQIGFGYQGEALNSVNRSTASGWQCSCGRVHPKYETSCVCGKSKFDNINCPKTEETFSETIENASTTDQFLFCRKCGEKLIGNSRFCRICGTEIERDKI